MNSPGERFPGQRPDGRRDDHGDDHPDTLDALRRVFADEPVVPLVPRPGTFESILTESTRRRRSHRRRLAGGALLVAAAAALAVAVPAGLLPREHSTRTEVATSPSGAATSSAAPTRGGPASSPASSTPSAPAPSTSAPASPVPPPVYGVPAGGPVPTGTRVVSVTTATAATLYALGTAPCSSPPCGVLVRSDDDGKSWVGLQPPDVPVVTDQTARTADPGRDPAGSIREVRFAGLVDGWVFGASTWVTHDGGAKTSSWRQVQTGGTVLDLATDGSTVWALAADCGAVQQGGSDACSRPRLLTGAVSVDQLTVDDAATALLPPTVRSASVQVAAGQVVVDVDGPTPVVLAPSRTGWQRLAVGGQPGGCADPTVVPAARGDRVLWSICPLQGSGAAGSSAVGFSTSTDGGAHWTSAGTLQVRNGGTVLAAVDEVRAAVATGAPGLGGSLQATADAGAHWAPGRGLPAAPDGWAWVGAAGGPRLLALPLEPAGTIWASDDAGTTWHGITVR